MLKKLYVLLGMLISFLCINCGGEDPGPISVENSVEPSVVNSGSYVTWTIKVTNMGGKVKIDRIHCREECISGWMQGQYAEMDIPLSNDEVSAHETEVVHSQTSPVLNTGPTDIQIKNTVTVYSDGGEDTDECIYTIKTTFKTASHQESAMSPMIENFIIYPEKQ